PAFLGMQRLAGPSWAGARAVRWAFMRSGSKPRSWVESSGRCRTEGTQSVLPVRRNLHDPGKSDHLENHHHTGRQGADYELARSCLELLGREEKDLQPGA